MTHRLRYAARTHRGLVRANNQDSVFAGDRLLVIADGMGGHAAGDVASRLVVEAFMPLNDLPQGADMRRPLVEATRRGNGAIADMVDENPELDGMGTTLTALFFDGPTVALAHVGDSRAYLYRNGVLHQISHDDTFVQSLVDDGRITPEEAAHHPQRSLLLRALNGTDMDPTVNLREISPGDRFLICSDGLSDYVAAEAIADALEGEDPDDVAEALVQLALAAGAPDNVTVIVADVLDTGAGATVAIPSAVWAEDDPDATGPLQPIHETQRMRAVPLPPIPEEAGVRPDYAHDDAGGEFDHADEFADDYEPEDDEDHPHDPDEHSTSPPRSRRWPRRILIAVVVLVLLAAGGIGTYVWASSKYYVGADGGGRVVIWRGVDGSLLGWHLASITQTACSDNANPCTPLRVTDLQAGAQSQVNDGITVSSLSDARGVLNRLITQNLLPICGQATTGTVATTSTTAPPASTASSRSVDSASSSGPAPLSGQAPGSEPVTSTVTTTVTAGAVSTTGPSTGTPTGSTTPSTSRGLRGAAVATTAIRRAAAVPTAKTTAKSTPKTTRPKTTPAKSTPKKTSPRSTPSSTRGSSLTPTNTAPTGATASSGLVIAPAPTVLTTVTVTVTPSTTASRPATTPSTANSGQTQVPGVNCRTVTR